MNNAKNYQRLWDSKILTAQVLTMTDAVVTYTINNGKQVHKENTNLFLKVFTPVS